MLLYTPYQSNQIPEQLANQFSISTTMIEEELRRQTDHFVSEIFIGNNPHETNISFPLSRLVLDPLPFPNDTDRLSRIGFGTIPTKTTELAELRRPLSRAESASLINNIYSPHHAYINELVDKELSKYGYCIFIECRTHRHKPLPFEPGEGSTRPFFRIGTDDYHTPKWMKDFTKKTISKLNYSVEINQPEAGCFIPSLAYNSNPRVMCIQISVNRSLFMNEQTLERGSRFQSVHRAIFQIKQIMQIQAEHIFNKKN